MYSLGRRRVPGIVSLALTLILLGLLLAMVSLWRLQTMSATGRPCRTRPRPHRQPSCPRARARLKVLARRARMPYTVETSGEVAGVQRAAGEN